MDPGFPNISRLKAHLKRRHYEQEHIPADVRYLLEQQRRTQNDRAKWESIYRILFPGETVPSPDFWDLALSLQGGSTDAYVSQSSNMLQETRGSTSHVSPMVMNGFRLGNAVFYYNTYNGIPYDELYEADADFRQPYWLPPS